MLPTLISAIALGIAIAAWIRSGAGHSDEEAREARRQLALEQSELERRTQAQERCIGMLLKGVPPTPEMMLNGQFFFDLGEGEARELASAKSAQWLDVRNANEVQAGIIPGATWIPMDEIESRIAELDPNDHLIVYCAAGGRSAGVCDFLSNQGFARLYNLEGGMGAWSGATEPLA